MNHEDLGLPSVRDVERYGQPVGRPTPDEILWTLRALTPRQGCQANERGSGRPALRELRAAAQLRLALLPERRPVTSREGRLLAVLERLLALDVGHLSVAMSEAAQRLAEVLHADIVDVFFYEPARAALIAAGISDTPMGRLQKAARLDVLPIANAGLVGRVFETGQSARVNYADQDPDAGELPRVVNILGVRSSLAAPLNAPGASRGVLQASSATPAAFTDEDLQFLEAVAHWLGLISARLAHARWLAAQAADQELREADNSLTARQVEVAALIRRGLTNAEIAQQLILDPGTVANHVANMLTRLGFRSRSQIAAWAAERRLGEDHLDGYVPISAATRASPSSADR